MREEDNTLGLFLHIVPISQQRRFLLYPTLARHLLPPRT
jgi:hypothetical protein